MNKLQLGQADSQANQECRESTTGESSQAGGELPSESHAGVSVPREEVGSTPASGGSKVAVIGRGASLSSCGTYRWQLTRKWSEGGRRVCWLMLNPSTADALKDDPTILRCIDFSQRWGFDAMVVVNLYPFRSSNPADCQKWADWEKNGPDWYARDTMQANSQLLVNLAKRSELVVAAFGAAPWASDYAAYVLEEITTGAEPWPSVYCLGLTQSGAPKHPLARGKHRIPATAQPILYRAGHAGISTPEGVGTKSSEEPWFDCLRFGDSIQPKAEPDWKATVLGSDSVGVLYRVPGHFSRRVDFGLLERWQITDKSPAGHAITMGDKPIWMDLSDELAKRVEVH